MERPRPFPAQVNCVLTRAIRQNVLFARVSNSSFRLTRLEELDQRVRRRIVRRRLLARRQFWQDLFCELLAKLDAHLVKRVDIPNHALNENLHFVHRDQAAEHNWRELFEKDGVRRTIARKDLKGRKTARFGGASASIHEAGFRFGQCLACHQRFGLSDEIRNQFRMMVASRIANRVMRLDRRKEIARDELRPLINELIERMLAVRARLAPNNLTSLVVDDVAVAIDALAVAFHIDLLEISGKTAHVLVISENRLSFGAPEIIVPNAKKRHQNWNIFAIRSAAEILVYLVRASKEFFEMIEPDGKRYAETDRAPKGVTSANPVPKFKHIVRIDTKLLDVFAIRRERHEMFRNGGLISGFFHKPAFRCFPVRHRLLGRERLRSDDEKRRFRIQILERFGNVRAVYV